MTKEPYKQHRHGAPKCAPCQKGVAVMIGECYKAIYYDDLSSRSNERFVIVNIKTGEILDDAQGYGFKSKSKAYKAFTYKLKQQKQKRGKSK